MIVMKKAISRRTILRGLGATVALPLLDAMVPALTAVAQTAAKGVKRLGVVYHPNGVIYEHWLPKGTGANFELSRTLAGLQPFKDQLLVVTNLFMDYAEALGDGGGDHSRASGGYLNGVHVKKSDTVLEAGISMDQIAARAFERETQLSSLQLQMDDNSLVGSCDVGYSCAYSSTISWLTPTLPLMTENNPRVVFERLFGATDSTDPKVRAARLRQDRSILDSVMDRVKQLQRQLGAADSTRVNDYLNASGLTGAHTTTVTNQTLATGAGTFTARSVNVSYPYTFVVLSGFAPMVGGGTFGSINLTAASIMRTETQATP